MGILLRSCHNPCPHRIEVQIATQFKKIGVLVNEDSLVSALKKMPCPSSLSVDVRGVRTIDIVHNVMQVTLRCLNDEMVVVGHKDVAVQEVAILILRLFEVVLHLFIVCLGKEDLPPLITTSGDVVAGPFVLYSYRSRHWLTLFLNPYLINLS